MATLLYFLCASVLSHWSSKRAGDEGESDEDDEPTQKEESDGDDEISTSATPTSASVLAACEQRGRPTARAERHTEKRRVHAEGAMWAPGGEAANALAIGWGDSSRDAEARLAAPLPPAAETPTLGEWARQV